MQTNSTIFKYIYRYNFMRFLIPFLCLILLASCHNKSDLKRIAELEEENKMFQSNNDSLRSEIMQKNNSQSNLLNIIGGFDQTKTEGVLDAFYFFTMNKIKKNRIQLNKETYYTELNFCVNHNFFVYEFSYSIPQKSRNLDQVQINLHKNNYFNFVPKDTGWYYWKGYAKIRNYRTDNISKYPITDSFYVYK